MPDEIKQPQSKTPRTDEAWVNYLLLDYQQRFNVMFATCEKIETELTVSESRAADLEARLAAVTKDNDALKKVYVQDWHEIAELLTASGIPEHNEFGEAHDTASRIKLLTKERDKARNDYAFISVENDQLRQRVEELLQILRDCDVTFANGAHRDNPIRRLIAMQLSTKPEGGDEPCAPAMEMGTHSTVDASNVIASNAAPESFHPTGTAATLEERVEELERKETRIDGRAALEKMLSETSEPTGTAAKNPFLNSTVTSNEGPIPAQIADEARRAIVGTAVKSHNPDNLTAEQVGVADGWRLLDEDEVISNVKLLEQIEKWGGGYWSDTRWWGSTKEFTYRTKLTRAELRKARGLEPEPAHPGSPESETEQTQAAGIRDEFCEIDGLGNHAPRCPVELERCIANLQNALDNARAQERVWRKTATSMRKKRDAILAQRDKLLEITWLDLPGEPNESFDEWQREFEKEWVRRIELNDSRSYEMQMRAERDAYAAEVTKLRAELDRWQSNWGAKDTEWLNMKNERDEALDDVAQLREVVEMYRHGLHHPEGMVDIVKRLEFRVNEADKALSAPARKESK